MKKLYSVLLFILIFNSVSAKPDDRTKAEAILQKKCMDCHSNETVYPWYAKFPIAKQLIEADVKKGRGYFNLPGMILNREDEKRIPKYILQRLENVVRNNAMPPIQYKVAHWDKVLTRSDQKALLDWLGRLNGKLIEPLPETVELNQAKVKLGNKLFHDKRLSGDNTISCASCHDLKKGGTDQAQFATGINGTKGHINSPTVYNASYNIKQFWDGRAEDLEAQAHGPVHNPAEMGSNWPQVLEKLRKDRKLISMFKKAYGVKNAKEVTGNMIANSIAEFEKSLVTPNSAFDRYLRGQDNAIGAEEKHGFELFKKYNCTNCHLGPAVGGESFARMGVMKDYFSDRANGKNGLKKMPPSKEDNGRFNVTKNEVHRYAFKVPILRNVELTYPYFHDGNVDSLEEAVRIMAEYQIGKEINKRDIELIVKFLKSLTDDNLAQ